MAGMEKDGSEVEAKYRLRAGQREALARALAGHSMRTFHQEDRYFEVGDRVLRLRRENDAVLLTAKDASTVGPDGVKSRREVEFPLTDEVAERLSWLFPWMGHRELTTVRKHRDQYQLEGACVTLDRIEGLPDDFAEIEILAGGDRERRIGELREWLGIAPDQVVTESYARLVGRATG